MHTLIIAEAGVNHNGDFELAKKLVSAAAQAGADFVKFQTFKADKIVSKTAKKADYQERNIHDVDHSQYAMLKKLEMPEEWHIQLMKYANECGIKFLSTGFDNESIDFLNQLGTPLFKSVKLHLDNGKTVSISADNNSEDNKYVKSMSINGKAYQRNYITHQQLMNGAQISYQMDQVPNRNRGISNVDVPYSLSNEK